MTRSSVSIVLAALVCLFLVPLAMAHEDDRDLVNILEGLERGIVALDRLGRDEEQEMLQRIANEVRRELRAHQGEGERSERDIVERQIEALRLALPALREERRMNAVEEIERAIHFREMSLHGGRDRQFRDARENAPERGQIVELLTMAEGIYSEYGDRKRAEMLSSATEDLWPRRRERRRDRARRRDGNEREQAMHQLEVLSIARHALLEAGRKDAAESLHQAIRAREVSLEGRRDDEAHMIRKRSPNVGKQVELLKYAARLWREFGHEEKAAACARMADRMWAAYEPNERSDRQREGSNDRMSRLERRLAELEGAMNALLKELQERRR